MQAETASGGDRRELAESRRKAHGDHGPGRSRTRVCGLWQRPFWGSICEQRQTEPAAGTGKCSRGGRSNGTRPRSWRSRALHERGCQCLDQAQCAAPTQGALIDVDTEHACAERGGRFEGSRFGNWHLQRGTCPSQLWRRPPSRCGQARAATARAESDRPVPACCRRVSRSRRTSNTISALLIRWEPDSEAIRPDWAAIVPPARSRPGLQP